MKKSERTLLALFAVVFVLGLGVATVLLLGRTPSGSGGPAVADTLVDDGSASARETSGPERVAPPPPPRAADPALSALPLVEVIVQRRFDPYSPSNHRGAPERGAGRKASLDGLVTDAGGRGVPGARLKFVGGLSAGEETTANEEGRYDFPRLYPGTQLLEVEIPGRDAIVREVRLLPDRPERANYHFATPLDVPGRVLDRLGKAIAGAEVRIDRRSVTTDEEGRFLAGAICPGDAIAYVSAKGFGPLRQTLTLRPGPPPEPDRLQFVLQAAATLVGQSGGSPGEGGPPFVALVPDTPPIDRSFPFERFGRVEIAPNSSFEVPGIPLRMLLRVRAAHPFAVARPTHRMVFLREEGERNIVPVDFRFSPVPTVRGRVVDGESGKPLAGASAALEVADLYRETVAALPGAGPHLTAYVATAPADLRCESTTDPEGKFALGTGEGSGWRWLAIRASGFRPLERAVAPGQVEVQSLVLFREETFEKGAELVVTLDPPTQVRVGLTLNGSAKEEEALPSGSPFVLSGLEPGLYDVKVRSGGRTLYSAPEVPIGRRRLLSVGY